MSSFHDFSLQPATLATLARMDITQPTPIQAQAIPALLAGNDLVGQSATGSGKTLAYGIPLVERVARNRREVQALILLPTRELAVQVNTVISKFAASRRLSTALLVGGRAYSQQISALRYGAQIVIGTPGRVQDHLERGSFVLSQLRVCVLDEADQMLDSGFAPMVEEILTTTPETRQMALFSATLPAWVQKLQEKFLKDPITIHISAQDGAQSTIEQIAYQVPREQKMAALCTLLLATQGESSLIFGKTKFGVERLGDQLSGLGFTVATLHGDKSQRARDEVLTAFRRGSIQTLLATNVAARGLDIQGIHQVINYELPESSDVFTHRIGRTGRMGQQGKAITLLVPSDVPKWRRMAHNLGQTVVLQRLVINKDATAPSVAPLEDVPAVNNDHALSVLDTPQNNLSSSETIDNTAATFPKRPERERTRRNLPARQIEKNTVEDVASSTKPVSAARESLPIVDTNHFAEPGPEDVASNDRKKRPVVSPAGRQISTRKTFNNERIVRNPSEDGRSSREPFEGKSGLERSARATTSSRERFNNQRIVRNPSEDGRSSREPFEGKSGLERSARATTSSRERFNNERPPRSFEERRSSDDRFAQRRNSTRSFEEKNAASRLPRNGKRGERFFDDRKDVSRPFREERSSGRVAGERRVIKTQFSAEKVSGEFFDEQASVDRPARDKKESSGRPAHAGKTSGKTRARAYVTVQKQRKTTKKADGPRPVARTHKAAKR